MVDNHWGEAYFRGIEFTHLKRPRKKNVIPPSRLKELQGNVVYEIRCGTPGCACSTPQAGCRRGFFSLFIQAVNGIAFAKRFDLPYHVNFGHMFYAYYQPGNTDRNFWNYYFDQPLKDTSSINNILVNEMIETYPLTIWARSYFRSMHEVMMQELVYKEDVAGRFATLKTRFDRHRVLGVHVRRTDHYTTTPPVNTEDYIKEVDRRLSDLTKYFLQPTTRRLQNNLQNDMETNFG